MTAARDDLEWADREFREKISETLGRIEAKGDQYYLKQAAIEATLYGPNGAGGLVRDVADLQHNTASWNRGLAIIQALITAALVYVGLKVK